MRREEKLDISIKKFNKVNYPFYVSPINFNFIGVYMGGNLLRQVYTDNFINQYLNYITRK